VRPIIQLYLATSDLYHHTLSCIIVSYGSNTRHSSRDLYLWVRPRLPEFCPLSPDRPLSPAEPLRGGTPLPHQPSTTLRLPVFTSMPGPGARRQKPKPKKPIQPPFVSLTDNPISTFANDIDHEEGWHIVVDMLCKHLQLPGML